MGGEGGPAAAPLLPHHRERPRDAVIATRRLGPLHHGAHPHRRRQTRMTFDPRTEIRRRAAQAGITLPDSTVDELVAYLEDLHSTALDEGVTAAEAHRRATAALEESAWT